MSVRRRGSNSRADCLTARSEPNQLTAGPTAISHFRYAKQADGTDGNVTGTWDDDEIGNVSTDR